MNWLASLNGNIHILYNLNNSNSPHFSIFEDSEDHQSEQYFLVSNHVKGIEEVEAVASAISGLIQLINGAAAIQWGFNNFEQRGNVKLDRLFFSKEEIPSDRSWTHAYINSEVVPSNPFIGSANNSDFLNPFNSATTGYIELCIEHEDIFNILRQISIGFDWRNLYCILDTVSHYGGGIKKTIKDLGLDESDIRAFTGTANSFGVLGLEARHGVMGWQIPKMVLNREQAIDIINDVVSKYLAKKVSLASMCESRKAESKIV